MPINNPIGLYDEDFYDSQLERSLSSARAILKKLFEFWKPQSVLDVGCGVGTWLHAASELGVKSVLGIDGDYVKPEMLQIPQHCFIGADLSSRRLPAILQNKTGRNYGLAMCLEVAEHLPFEKSKELVEDLTEISDVVLFSAAAPFQYGTNHINEQWAEFWALLFREKEYACYDLLRDRFWNSQDVEWWYAQNILIFARRGSKASEHFLPFEVRRETPLSKVHPLNFLVNLLSLHRRYGSIALREEDADYRILAHAFSSGDNGAPDLLAIRRAAESNWAADDVFPKTRTEISYPEQEYEEIHKSLVLAQEMLQDVSGFYWSSLSDLRNVDELLGDLTDALDASKQEEAILRARVDSNTANVDRLKIEQQQLNSRAKSLETTLEQRSVELDNVEKKLSIKLADYEHLLVKYKELQVEYEALIQRHASSSMALSNSITSLANSQQRMAIEFRNLKKLNQLEVRKQGELVNQLDELRAERDELLARLNSITDSTSWKASYPVRKIASRLPQGARTALRRTAKILWWLLTLQLFTRYRQWAKSRVKIVLASPSPSILLEENAQAQEALALDRAMTRLRNLSLFDEGYYRDLHRDVNESGMNAYAHVILHGASEGRKLFRRERLARVISNASERPISSSAKSFVVEKLSDGCFSNLSVGIYVSSLGNMFMHEIAEDLVSDLRSIGVNAQLRDEKSDINEFDGKRIIVAPHEFFRLGAGINWDHPRVIANSVMFTTEQVQTTWFGFALPYVLKSSATIDIAQQTAEIFREAGISAMHYEPTTEIRAVNLRPSDYQHPLFRALPKAAQGNVDYKMGWMQRPLDVCFFGAETDARELFFARSADYLSTLRTFLSYRRAGGPILKNSDDSSLTRLAAHVSSFSRISLNLHREEFGYFEWHRIVRLAMANGSVVVSEPCLPHPVYKPGIHYFEESARHIPQLLDWLLNSEDGQRAAIAANNAVYAELGSTEHARSRSIDLVKFLVGVKAWS